MLGLNSLYVLHSRREENKGGSNTLIVKHHHDAASIRGKDVHQKATKAADPCHHKLGGKNQCGNSGNMGGE